MKIWSSITASFKSNLLPWACLIFVIALAIIVRIQQPVHHPGIGEIDVYYWALRTQELELQGFQGVGTPLWFTPVFMSILHRMTSVDFYSLFLWAGTFISAIFPTVAVYLLSKELTQSKIAGLFGALLYSLTSILFYRSVFTVSETFAYTFIPWVLYLSIHLAKKRSLLVYIVLMVSFFFSLSTHDSSKLLYLPVFFGSLVFFWTTRKQRTTQIAFIISIAAGVLFLIRNPEIIGGIKFFLSPSSTGNAAFGNYDALHYTAYTSIAPIFFTGFALFGFFAALWFHRRAWASVVQLSMFALPIIFYQQVLPRISDATIVPTRLTPYLTFIIAPFLALAVLGWLRLTRGSRQLQIVALSVVLIFILTRVSVADFPLSYITSPAEQASLLKLPITHHDYLIAQTGMIGMTALATKTNESNYYGDSTDRIFGATSAQDVRLRLRKFTADSGNPPTGILISKWKLTHRDPYYGWWDSLVNPSLNVDIFRSANFPVRFEDENILLIDIPSTI